MFLCCFPVPRHARAVPAKSPPAPFAPRAPAARSASQRLNNARAAKFRKEKRFQRRNFELVLKLLAGFYRTLLSVLGNLVTPPYWMMCLVICFSCLQSGLTTWLTSFCRWRRSAGCHSQHQLSKHAPSTVQPPFMRNI
jgi:4-amino-4-deoxy-L-arabinose transferase-like glycosyltransferase